MCSKILQQQRLLGTDHSEESEEQFYKRNQEITDLIIKIETSKGMNLNEISELFKDSHIFHKKQSDKKINALLTRTESLENLEQYQVLSGLPSVEAIQNQPYPQGGLIDETGDQIIPGDAVTQKNLESGTDFLDLTISNVNIGHLTKLGMEKARQETNIIANLPQLSQQLTNQFEGIMPTCI